MLENRVTCLIIPGRTGLTEDGVVDILKESGLSQSRLFEVQQDHDFQIDRQRWLTGYLPTLNYQATVGIYRLIEPDCALEVHMARTPYAAVVGVRSTALLIARQIYAPEVRVRAFGWSAVNFKTPDERKDMRTTFEQCGVEIE